MWRGSLMSAGIRTALESGISGGLQEPGTAGSSAVFDRLAVQVDPLDIGAEDLEGLGDLLPPVRRGTSVTWWESGSAETPSEPETFTEYTLDSEDTSVSSTRASTSATGTTGSVSRLSRRSARGFNVVVRGGRSPHSLLHGAAPHGYRGRSVTRRERQNPGAANRHRHPTHTPSRRPETPTRRALATVQRGASMFSAGSIGGIIVPRLGFHEIGRVREEPAEGG